VQFTHLSSTLHEHDNQEQGVMATNIKPFFQYRVVNLFMFIISLLKLTCTVSDSSLHQLPN
jgi:hypothetical protein